MKKIICLMIAIIMIIACTISVGATDYYGYDNNISNDQNSSSGTIEVSGHVYSHFTITIPEYISVENPNDGVVRATDVSLEDNYVINIGVDNLNDNNKITLTHTSDDSATTEMSINGNYTRLSGDTSNTIIQFTNNDFANGDSAEAWIACQLDGSAKAGDYQGVIMYSVACEPVH